MQEEFNRLYCSAVYTLEEFINMIREAPTCLFFSSQKKIQCMLRGLRNILLVALCNLLNSIDNFLVMFFCHVPMNRLGNHPVNVSIKYQ